MHNGIKVSNFVHSMICRKILRCVGVRVHSHYAGNLALFLLSGVLEHKYYTSFDNITGHCQLDLLWNHQQEFKFCLSADRM